MSNPENIVLHVVHIASVVTLIAFTFYGFAAATESRKPVMIITGIATLLILLTGIRMWQGLYAWHGAWVYVKAVCWLGLAGLAGIGYRKRDSKGAFMTIVLLLAIVALVMVYWKPGT